MFFSFFKHLHTKQISLLTTVTCLEVLLLTLFLIIQYNYAVLQEKVTENDFHRQREYNKYYYAYILQEIQYIKYTVFW